MLQIIRIGISKSELIIFCMNTCFSINFLNNYALIICDLILENDQVVTFGISRNTHCSSLVLDCMVATPDIMYNWNSLFS